MTTPLATVADALIEFILSLLRDPERMVCVSPSDFTVRAWDGLLDALVETGDQAVVELGGTGEVSLALGALGLALGLVELLAQLADGRDRLLLGLPRRAGCRRPRGSA